MGCIRWFLFSVAATYFLWHLYDILTWMLDDKVNLAKRRWSQIWAWIIGGTGMATAVFALILIPIRRSERITRYLASKGWAWPDDPSKSAQGQWYDDPNLTAKDLQWEEHDGDDAAKPRG
jgi:hypothetical protein